MAFKIGAVVLIIVACLLGATLYSLIYEDKPLLFKKKYQRKH